MGENDRANITNVGGNQFNNYGPGTQYNNSGTGSQFIGQESLLREISDGLTSLAGSDQLDEEHRNLILELLRDIDERGIAAVETQKGKFLAAKRIAGSIAGNAAAATLVQNIHLLGEIVGW